MVVVALVFGTNARVHADALAKLNSARLQASHDAVAALRGQRKELPRGGPYHDYRAALHVHSALSHDSRGTIDEIVKAAVATGTRVILFTEHPSDKHDFFLEGHRGIKNGVLLIPGAETRGFLAYPTKSIRGLQSGSPQEFSDLVRRTGGLTFLSHLEERMDWRINGLTGVEIYNTHADVKDEKNLLAALRNPLWIHRSAALFKQYPQEAFSALQDYPADYLRRWDQLCQIAPHTGVSANDAHQNTGLIVRLAGGGKLRLEDALGKKLIEFDAALMAATLGISVKNKNAGDILFQLRLDPYEVSLRHVGTHLLLKELNETAVWDALQAGRAFVAFDWLTDSTGFDFAAVLGPRRIEMGSQTPLAPGLQLQAGAPLPVSWRLLRDGKLVAKSQGRDLRFAVGDSGIYRVEAWLSITGDEMIWILSNPIYVRLAK